MITLRRAGQRHYQGGRERELWLTFNPANHADRLGGGFGVLEMLNEDCLPPGAVVAGQPLREAEILTYVREGALAYEDSLGGTGIITAGEVERMTAGRGVRHSETNASRDDWAHVFQLWMQRAEPGLEPGRQQQRLSAANRRGHLCVIASRDARSGSLRLHADAGVYSAILDAGQHTVLELGAKRQVWLHVVEGEIAIGDVVLGAGDGIGVEDHLFVSFTARIGSEILLADLGEIMPA